MSDIRLIDADALKENMFHYAAPEMVWDRGDIEHKINEMPIIDAIPVEWLKQQYQKCEEIKNKIPITLEPNIHDVAVGLTCTELIGAIDIVLNLYAGWKKEQEAQDGKFR